MDVLEQIEQLERMEARIREEAAKFPEGFDSRRRSDFWGDGPMYSSIELPTPYGDCGCFMFMADRLNIYWNFDSKCLPVAVSRWPEPFRSRYNAVHTVREQYGVMADLIRFRIDELKEAHAAQE